MNKTMSEDFMKENSFYINKTTSYSMNNTISENTNEISFTELLYTSGKLLLLVILFCIFIWVCYKAHQGRKRADERRANRGGRIYAGRFW